MPPTLRLFANDPTSAESKHAIAQAAEILRAGGVVAFATETVYGLGANALHPDAVAKIFVAKGRPAWDPLIVHAADMGMVAEVARALTPPAQAWAQKFWPGPLTLLLERNEHVPLAVTAGRPLVGVRVPRHPVAQALLHAAAIPIAAPSANRFGHVSPSTADHVLADLDGRIDAVLDGGPTEIGVESTVVDATTEPCTLYRPGAVTLEQLRSAWPRVEPYTPPLVPDGAGPQSLPSPGVGIRHYAPRARLLLVECGDDQPKRFLQAASESAERVGLLLPDAFFRPDEEEALPSSAKIFPWGRWGDPASLARSLFAGLRALDRSGVDLILCPLPPVQGLGAALVDRLRKAARSE